MGCQREIAAKIGKEQGNYVLAVKENQPVLYKEVKEYFEGLESGEIGDLPEDLWITAEERGHGRREKRDEENGAFPVTGGPNSPACGEEKDNRSQMEIYRFHEPGLYVHRPVRKVNAGTLPFLSNLSLFQNPVWF
jgi:hypothetical protein